MDMRAELKPEVSKQADELPDVQVQPPEHPIPLTRVGVMNLRYPVIFNQEGKHIETLVTISASVDLPQDRRGAHMSRFAEEIARLFHVPPEAVSITELVEQLARQLLRAHDYAQHCTISLEAQAHTNRNVYTVFASYNTATQKCTIGVEIIGALACPCAIALTGGLSHNQRGTLRIELETNDHSVRPEDLTAIAEQSFSTPVRLLLKRPDEKRVVTAMHSKPKFVEDVVRDCVTALMEHYHGLYARVRCVSFESIHPYDCFAEWEGVL
ncbi:MAG TPA: GTP cyclohydrolase I FolE2 [Armatimonadetes bacterium]|nr:GTP cyclohydrolase I FolE2 [Armatimonadota bacterium]